MISTKRRVFLKGTLAAGTVGVAVGAGLLAPSKLLAAWPSEMFEAEGLDAAMEAALGSSDIPDSDDIDLSAPEIAENGAVVPVSVETGMDDVSEIAIFVEKNDFSLSGRYVLADGTKPKVSSRIRMGESSNVIAAVKSGDDWYKTVREVKVTVGGCGG
ncbi:MULTISPECIES: thiosulfate oxidation carrier protein SoxY [unclassified Thioalkalivibrio]|uniref:thiosulfate oxidation carrier protein SoxY n=1 Tax=unclassified Thioalkalivibrio TaxID=2621013 RepID=UPI0003796F65|nr:MULTISPECIES: thiosulfate oxidation carrier protein SoxY [unclassified Thioalkalivibrio]